jgi:hypothetical protein
MPVSFLAKPSCGNILIFLLSVMHLRDLYDAGCMRSETAKAAKAAKTAKRGDDTIVKEDDKGKQED